MAKKKIIKSKTTVKKAVAKKIKGAGKRALKDKTTVKKSTAGKKSAVKKVLLKTKFIVKKQVPKKKSGKKISVQKAVPKQTGKQPAKKAVQKKKPSVNTKVPVKPPVVQKNISFQHSSTSTSPKRLVDKERFGNKKRFQAEYSIKSSPKILYNYLSTPSGLAAWFAEKVTYNDGVFTFLWEQDETRKAKLIHSRENQLLRYQWMDEEDNSYFQFEIVQDDLTLDVALIVTDFSTDEEREKNILLWTSQIHDLMYLVGSF